MGENRHDFYANAANIATSHYDILVRFRTQSPVFHKGPDEQQLIEEIGVCDIHMSPQHAKSVAALLVKHIVDYENQHNIELPIPSDMQEFWNQYINPTKEGG